MNLTNIIQLIASAVSIRVSQNLSDHLSAIQPGKVANSWFARPSSFGSQIGEKAPGWIAQIVDFFKNSTFADKIKSTTTPVSYQRAIERGSDRVDSIQGRRNSLRERLRTLNDTMAQARSQPGMFNPSHIAHLQHAIDVYTSQFDEATEDLRQYRREQDKLNQAVQDRIKLIQDGATDEDITAVDRTKLDLDRFMQKRDAAENRYNTARQRLTDEYLNSTGRTTAQLNQMAATVDRLRIEFERLNGRVSSATDAYESAKDTARNRTSASKSAQVRRGSTASRRVRQAFSVAGRLLGRRFRVRTKGFRNLVRGVMNPKAARARVNVMASNGAAGEAVQSAAMVARVGEMAAALGAVVGVAAAAIGVFVAAVYLMAKAVNAAADAGKRATEFYRAERSRFSGQILNAVARYDAQSARLEARSSMATGNSASGVVEATMALRESMQARSERWETLYNTGLATLIDIATVGSDVLEFFDILSPVLQTGINGIRGILQAAGAKLTKIEENTRKENSVAGVQTIIELQRGNATNRTKKAFPPPTVQNPSRPQNQKQKGKEKDPGGKKFPVLPEVK